MENPEQVRLMFSCFHVTVEFDYWVDDQVRSHRFFVAETEKISTVLRELLRAVEDQESFEARMFLNPLESRTTSYIACFFDAEEKNLFLDISDGNKVFKVWGLMNSELIACIQGMKEVVDRFRRNASLLYRLHNG
jgi:Cys-tRNA synthase (O-phospho-L-seryl-tRNA:Cys-tRNA synthase)